MKTSSQNTTLNNESGHQQFIIANLDRLAAIAWRNFLDAGRGAILLDLRERDCISQADYIPQGAMISKAIELGFEPIDYAGLVVAADFYDPERQVIFVIIRPDGQFADYVHTAPPGPTPPQAFLQHIAPASLDSTEAASKAITS